MKIESSSAMLSATRIIIAFFPINGAEHALKIVTQIKAQM